MLIEAGMDINHEYPREGSLLLGAVLLNRAESVRELIMMGADVDYMKNDDLSPLIVAIRDG